MEKRKVILGLKHPSEFSLEEKRLIVDEYIQSDLKKSDIWKKYTGQPEERGRILRWMRQLGYDMPHQWEKSALQNSSVMAKPKQDVTDENIQLKERISELEKALVHSELRASGLDTMIEIAEKELKLNIRKKSYTKQSSK